jgi:outer membrane protein TolC
MSRFCSCTALVSSLALAGLAAAQTPRAITLQDAMARARQYGTQIQAANLDVAIAKEEKAQAKAAGLPSLSAFNQFIYTEGNGTPSGVFVANDGVHVYNEQAQVHEEALTFIRRGEVRRAMTAEALARAKAEVARRGLTATVVQDYYTILAGQRRFVNAQASLREAEQFLDITQKLEKGGEVAHTDVIKAQITLQQRQRDLQDAQLNIDKTRISLGVLIFPDFRSDFTVEDDVQQPVVLPPFPEAQAKATSTSPDLQSARLNVQQAGYDIDIARYGYLPGLSLDFFYGIDANQFAARSSGEANESGRSTEPNYQVLNRQNLGYSAQATLNIPVWNWGATRSKVKQATLRAQQAELELTLAQRTLQGNLATAYSEAQAAQAQLDSLRSSSDLAAESLRLTLLRYQAGEADALEVVDAQSTLTQARNAYDDGLVRYRVALVTLQTLTGTL